jgi:hypothetical protein
MRASAGRASGAAAAVVRSAHAAFVCATQPMRIAVSGGGTADQQLEAMTRGFADLVASEWGRALSLLDVTSIPQAAANRVRRHRRLLATLARNVLNAGTTSGEFAVAQLDDEVHHWIRLADSLPRWLSPVPECERRTIARWVFASLANTYRDAADRGRRAGRRRLRTARA